jgi:hypothetical protein
MDVTRERGLGDLKAAAAQLAPELVLIRSAPWAMASTSPTLNSRPVTPSSISSGTPPTRVAMEGTLQAMASSAARPKDSNSLGIRSKVGEREQLVDALLLAEEVDFVLDMQVAGEPLGGRALGAVANQDQLAAGFAHDLGEDLHHVGDALDGAEIGEVDQDASSGAARRLRASAVRPHR